MSNRNHPRIDLYRVDVLHPNIEPVGTFWVSEGWRWRLWGGSRKVGASTQTYTEKRGAIENLEFACNGTFKRISTPQHPTPWGLLSRVSTDGEWTVIPVRLKGAS